MPEKTYRQAIIDAAVRREALADQLKAADEEYWAAVKAASEAGASLRQLAPIVGASASTIMRKLGHVGPQIGPDPLDLPTSVRPVSPRAQHPGAERNERPA